MLAQQLNVEVISHNIANMNTTVYEMNSKVIETSDQMMSTISNLR